MSSPLIQVESARDLGAQFTRNPHRMIGQDGAFSIPLAGGDALWFFGDTLIGRRLPGHSIWVIDGKFVGHADMTGRGPIDRMFNNTGLLLKNRTGANGLTDFSYITNPDGSLKTLLPLEGAEQPDWDRIWCQHGIELGNRIYLSFIKVKMLDETGPLPVMFEIVGSGLAASIAAAGSKKDWNFKRITHNGDSILWKANEPHFATAFLLSPDHDYVYLYGTVKRDLRQLCYVARVAPDRIEQIDQYEYLTSAKPQWSRDLSQAIAIFDGMPSELSVSFNPFLGAYLAVHSLDLSGKLVGRTSSNPWGPFSAPVELWQAKAEIAKELDYITLIYAGKEHPELSAEDGRVVYLTYIEFEEYFPHLIEVKLKR
jgi:hypothetical protein